MTRTLSLVLWLGGVLLVLNVVDRWLRSAATARQRAQDEATVRRLLAEVGL